MLIAFWYSPEENRWCAYCERIALLLRPCHSNYSGVSCLDHAYPLQSHLCPHGIANHARPTKAEACPTESTTQVYRINNNLQLILGHNVAQCQCFLELARVHQLLHLWEAAPCKATAGVRSTSLGPQRPWHNLAPFLLLTWLFNLVALWSADMAV